MKYLPMKKNSSFMNKHIIKKKLFLRFWFENISEMCIVDEKNCHYQTTVIAKHLLKCFMKKVHLWAIFLALSYVCS